MRILPYLLFAGLLSVIYIYVFIIPQSADKFSLTTSAVQEGQAWRFLTYPFAHLDMSHLIKNLIGLMIITAGIIALKTGFSDFSSIYMIAGFIAVLPLWFMLQFTALGASVAIYSVFGIIALESKKYKIKEWHILALIAASIFLEAIFAGNKTSWLSSFSHFSGLLFGVFAFFFAKKIHKTLDRKKMYSLRRI
jgi:membrane associated rhomboid family serine protease